MKAFIADKRMEHPHPRREVKGIYLSGTRLAVKLIRWCARYPKSNTHCSCRLWGQIQDMASEESDALFDKLFTFATSDRFSYYHRWRVGDTIIWNNRGLVHRAMPWDRGKYRRLVQRTEISDASTA